MIIDCIGCLHGARPDLEGGDLLIITGDLTANHEIYEFILFQEWLEKQKYSNKIFISGNHDTFLENVRLPNGLLPYSIAENTEYLCDSGTEFQGLKIWGSPWTASFKGINPKCKAFTVREFDHTEEILEEYWKKIPDDTDILVTHSPPYDIFDKTARGVNAGSKSLLIRTMKIKPKLHVFSHIHEQGGQTLIFKRPGYGTENNTIFINCSIMNEKYRPVNKPVRVVL